MPENDALEDSIDIAASAEVVWSLVSDVCRMPQWSPQVSSTRLRSGFETVEIGTEFTNRNEEGELTWTTHGEIVRWEPGKEIAFKIQENWVVWSFLVQAKAEGRTELTQRRDAPEGISDLSRELTEGFMGGKEAFTDIMRAGMRTTLEAIKVEAERNAG